MSDTAREKKKKVLHHDLDHLAGLWSREESAAFDKYLGIQRKVDEDLCKKSKGIPFLTEGTGHSPR